MHDEIAGTCGEHVLEKQRIISVKGDQRATLLLYCPWNRRVASRHSIRCDEALAGGKPLAAARATVSALASVAAVAVQGIPL